MGILLNQYYEYLRTAGKSDKTIKLYRLQLVSFYRWLESNGIPAEPDKLTSANVLVYRSFLQEKPLKPNSVNTAISYIVAYFTWLVRLGILNKNPAVGIRTAPLPAAVKWLTKRERRRVIDSALEEKNKRNTAIILTLLFSGVLVSELNDLRPADVDLQAGNLTIHSKNRNRLELRVIPMPSPLRQCLTNYLISNAASNNQWLFQSRFGRKLTQRGVNQICAKISKKARVKGLSPHVLRHTYGNDLITTGANPRSVAYLMGYIRTDPLQRYVDAIDSDQLVKRLGRL